MKNEFTRELKYLVVKRDDIDKYLTKDEVIELDTILLGVAKGRIRDGKKANSYVVVNQDEPYAEKVWELIQAYWEEANEPTR